MPVTRSKYTKEQALSMLLREDGSESELEVDLSDFESSEDEQVGDNRRI